MVFKAMNYGLTYDSSDSTEGSAVAACSSAS